MKMPLPHLNPRRRRAAGLTLIELMVAMVIGLVIMAGILYIFLGSKQTFRQGDAMARLQENGRLGLEAIASDLRMTSYSGCASVNSLQPTSLVNDDSGGTAITLSDDTVVDGRVYSDGDDLVSDGVAGSDIFAVKHISERIMRMAAAMTSRSDPIVLTKTDLTPKFKAGQIASIATCQTMDIFRVTGVNESSSTITLAHAQGTGSEGNKSAELSFALKFQQVVRAGELVEQTYYVKNTGRTNAAGNPIRALFRVATVNGIANGSVTSTEEELAEGIEDMRVTYGLDTDGDGDVDEYRATSAMSTATRDDWKMVLSARIELLVASTEDGTVDSAQPYTFNGSTTTPGDRKLRTSIGTTVSLRNRVHLQ